MPSYNTTTVATALRTSPKWLDNLLSHNKIEGVVGGRQGVQRRLSADAVRTVALVRELTDHAGLPTPIAVRIASAMLKSTALTGDTTVGSHELRRRTRLSSAVWLELDLAALDRDVSAGLAHAVEITPHPLRGRPRRTSA